MRDKTLKAPINEFIERKDRCKLVQSWVTSPEFDFDMNDIKRLRKEIASLIDKLFDLYWASKREQKMLRREMKRKEEENEKLIGNADEVNV